VTEFLDAKDCVPAVGQGALSIECRADDHELLTLLSHFTDEATQLAVQAERTFLHVMEGGCQVPIAGYAEVAFDKEISLTALIASPDGKEIYKERITGKDPVAMGKEVSERLIAQGAKQLIDKVKEELDL
jgi:hydroxymethylbilane synthase